MPDGVKPQTLHACVKVIALIARRHGLDLSPSRIVHDHALDAEPSIAQLLTICEAAGLKARHARLDWDGLGRLGDAAPVLLRLADGTAVAFAGLTADGSRAIILDPRRDDPRPAEMQRGDLEAIWQGDTVLVRRHYRLGDVEQPFGLRWFIAELLGQRGALRDVAIAAMFLNLLALAVPIFFQLVVDKVLVHQSMVTLAMLAIGVTAALGFEAILNWLRGLILLHATKKVDARIALRTYGHLVSLPASFFGGRTAGVLAKHMEQSGQIRNFLTGQAMMLMLDLTVLIVLLPVLLLYSVQLTLLVLGFTALVALVVAVIIPVLQRRLKALYEAEAARQSHLIETIHGMATVKALAIEPEQSRHWDLMAGDAVRRTVDVGAIRLTARTLVQLLEKLMLVGVIGFGVFLVFDGTMTVGALIAFQMLSGRVSGPLVQLVSLAHEYQETALAVRMLGQIMNAPAERPAGARALRPQIRGRITFERVQFSYPGAPEPALAGVGFDIPAGATVGIVGRSGSGKTTLARLIQGIHPAQSGAVRIDGIDIREIDLAHLRANIGVVLQEPFLFRGTVRENIQRARPDSPFEAVVEAAHRAGAHGFIERLPQGYDTQLEESAANLSGGQRQRLAIARALMRDPPILILDEATSALDPESEAVVQDSLRGIRRGRTVIIISHRLSMLHDADSIIVMDRGRIVAAGPHAELARQDGLYSQLWRRQMQAAG